MAFDGELVMYTTTWCGYCVRLKRFLDSESLPRCGRILISTVSGAVAVHRTPFLNFPPFTVTQPPSALRPTPCSWLPCAVIRSSSTPDGRDPKTYDMCMSCPSSSTGSPRDSIKQAPRSVMRVSIARYACRRTHLRRSVHGRR